MTVSGNSLILRSNNLKAGLKRDGLSISFYCSRLLFLCCALMGWAWTSQALAFHFPEPVHSTPFFCTYMGQDFRIDGEPAQPGDELAFVDPDGVICGHFVVQTAGQYGFVQIYGDDAASPVDEGARSGDILEVRIWDASRGLEYSGNSVRLRPGDAVIGSAVPSLLPPRWYDLNTYVMNIAVEFSSGDINRNGGFDLSDAMQVLAVLNRQTTPDGEIKTMDVDGNGRIGSEELLYILRKISGL